MTEEEWKDKAHRVAIAFNAQNNAAMRMQVIQFDDEDTETYEAEFEVDDLTIRAAYCDFAWSFLVSNKSKRTGRLGCSIELDHSLDVDMNGCPESLPLLIRALLCLGYDISTLEKSLNLNITAHEKLEWQLEFQRRLREETAQVE